MSKIKLILKSAWAKYVEHLQVKNPIKTKMAGCFVLYSVGDIICQAQEISRKRRAEILVKQKYDAMRTFRQGAAMAFFMNPFAQLYIMKIAPLITIKKAASKVKLSKSEKLRESVLKAFIHFFGGAPSTISLFLFGSAYLKRCSVNDGIQNCKDKFWITFKLALAYWPFVYFFGYQYVPRHF